MAKVILNPGEKYFVLIYLLGLLLYFLIFLITTYSKIGRIKFSALIIKNVLSFLQSFLFYFIDNTFREIKQHYKLDACLFIIAFLAIEPTIFLSLFISYRVNFFYNANTYVNDVIK